MFAADICSAVSEEECAELARMAEGRLVLEMGSQYGRSTVALASTARHVHAVDWHQGDKHTRTKSEEAQDSLGAFIGNLAGHEVRDRVTVHVGRFEDVCPVLRPRTFDLVFLDGFHDEASVERDLGWAQLLVSLGGMIACHDYGRDCFGVKGAVDRSGLVLLRVVDSMAVLAMP